MSTLIVKIHRLNEIKPHSNADKLEIAVIDGWQCIIGKGTFKVGDLVCYIPPDCVLTETLAERYDVKNYLGKGHRVKSIRLRGEYSHGLLIKAPDGTKVGQDVADILGITKWIPPLISTNARHKSSNQAPNHPRWMKYDGPEHLRNYPYLINEGEEVTVSEKIHGCFWELSPVLMSNNTYKYIKDIKIGDFVKSFNEKTKEFIDRKVSRVFNSGKSDVIVWMKLTLENGKTIICTSNHKFLTLNGWIEAQKITSEMEIISY